MMLISFYRHRGRVDLVRGKYTFMLLRHQRNNLICQSINEYFVNAIKIHFAQFVSIMLNIRYHITDCLRTFKISDNIHAVIATRRAETGSCH